MFKDPPCGITKTPIHYTEDTEVVILNLKEKKATKGKKVEDLPKLGPGPQVNEGVVITEQTNERIFRIDTNSCCKKIIAVIGAFELSTNERKKRLEELKAQLDPETRKQINYLERIDH